MDEPLTLQQAANWLGISHCTAWRMRDQLGARKVTAADGPRLQVEAANVRAYITANTVRPPDSEEPAMLPTAEPEYRLYTFPQVAETWGIPLRSLEDGARAQRFEHVRFGKQRRMTKAQVEQYIAAQTAAAEAGKDPLAGVKARLATRGTSTKRSPANGRAA